MPVQGQCYAVGRRSLVVLVPVIHPLADHFLHGGAQLLDLALQAGVLLHEHACKHRPLAGTAFKSDVLPTPRYTLSRCSMQLTATWALKGALPA